MSSSSQFLDKQIMGLSGSQNDDLLDLLNPREKQIYAELLMNSPQLTDKQVMGLSGSQKHDFLDRLNPQEEQLHVFGDGLKKESKEEILPSYDFQPIQPLRASHSINLEERNVGGIRGHNLVDSMSNSSNLRTYGSLGTIESAKITQRKDRNAYHSEMVSEIDRTMKVCTDNLLHVLEGVSARLSQLESRTHQLESSIDDLKISVGNNHGNTDGKLRQLDNLLREVQMGVQVLRDKQEIAEAQLQLAKLQASKGDQKSENQNSSTFTGSVQQAASAPQQSIPPPVALQPPPQQSQQSQQSIPPPVALQPPPQQSHQSIPPPVGLPQLPQQSQQLIPPTVALPLPPQQLPALPHPNAPLPPSPQLPPSQVPSIPQREPYFPPPGQLPETTHLPYQLPPPQQPQPPPPIPQQPYQSAPQLPQYTQPPQQHPHTPVGPVNPSPPQLQPPLSHHSEENLYMLPQSYPPIVRQQPPSQQFYGAPPPHMYEPTSSRPNSGVSSGYAPPSGTNFNDNYPYSGSPSHYSSSTMKPPLLSSSSSTPSGGSNYPRLPTAKILPHALPTVNSDVGGSSSGGSGNRVPVDDVVDKVATMGFSRDQVRATVRRLTENGQSVDLNVVLDKLMNDGEAQPQKVWFDR